LGLVPIGLSVGIGMVIALSDAPFLVTILAWSVYTPSTPSATAFAGRR
jgi:hypothetical protein